MSAAGGPVRLRLPVLAGVVYLVLLAALAPARLAASLLPEAFAGSVRLSAPAGTLWSGSADVQVVVPECGAPVPAGRWSWRVSADGRADVTVALRQGEGDPARLARVGGHWVLRGLRATLPGRALCAVPAAAPFRPDGEVAIGIEQWRFDPGGATGRAVLEWRGGWLDAGLPGAVGDHRLVAEGRGDGRIGLLLTPLGGPLRIAGQGDWTPGSGLRARGEITVGPGGEAFHPWLGAVAARIAPDRYRFHLEPPAAGPTASPGGTRLRGA